MYMFHIALSLTLIALTAGSALYVFSARCEGKGTCLAKFISMLVIFISVISAACTVYCGYNMRKAGNDEQCLLCAKHGSESQDAKSMDDSKSADKKSSQKNNR